MHTIETLTHDGKTYLTCTVAELKAAGVPDGPILDAIRRHLRTQVDETAERMRLSLITPGAGQAMEYQEAQGQADRALAETGTLAESDYPMLAASLGIDIDPETMAPATDIRGVARSIRAARDLWLVIGSDIRRVRLEAKRAIDTATSIEEAEAALRTAAWPMGVTQA